MHRECMTSKERWLAVLKHEEPDRIPMDYWGTKEVTEKLMQHLKCNDELSLFKHLHIDKMITVKGEYVGPSIPKDQDVFGCRHKEVNYGTGSYWENVYHPLAQYNTVDEINDNYEWPSADWWDYSSIRNQLSCFEDYPICGGGSEPFLIYKKLRGQEQAFMDMVLNPEIVHFCLDKLFELCFQSTRRIYEQIPGQVMLTFVAEDMGAQEGLMFSPAQIREFLLPRMKRIIDLAHEASCFVFHHNDGSIAKIIPDLIDIGIDILNPIQWRCKGMEREIIKVEFGDKLILHGGVDNQEILAFGTQEDIHQEVVDNISILGKGGGYILAPCHNIQPISPPENIVEMYETGYANGWV